MARILLFFYGGNDADLIECPQHIADNLKKYQRQLNDTPFLEGRSTVSVQLFFSLSVWQR